MHKILEKVLVKKYPIIFKDYGGNIRKTCMGWGITCGKGWFLLIDELCSKLSDAAVALQVKEKLGGLRFYVNGTDEDHKIENDYEGKSFEICEDCGEPAKLENKDGWLKTICSTCEDRQKLSAKIRSGKYAYSIDQPHHIVIFDPIEEKTIFSDSINEFMEIVGPELQLLEDKMNIHEKPLWNQID